MDHFVTEKNCLKISPTFSQNDHPHKTSYMRVLLLNSVPLAKYWFKHHGTCQNFLQAA